MVNWFELGIVFVLVFTGTAVSWLASEIGRWSGWQVPDHSGGGFERFGIGDWAMAVFTGPRYLLHVAWSGWRFGAFAPSLAALAVLVAFGWAALLGIMVLELAFLGGYALA